MDHAGGCQATASASIPPQQQHQHQHYRLIPSNEQQPHEMEQNNRNNNSSGGNGFLNEEQRINTLLRSKLENAKREMEQLQSQVDAFQGCGASATSNHGNASPSPSELKSAFPTMANLQSIQPTHHQHQQQLQQQQQPAIVYWVPHQQSAATSPGVHRAMPTSQYALQAMQPMQSTMQAIPIMAQPMHIASLSSSYPPTLDMAQYAAAMQYDYDQQQRGGALLLANAAESLDASRALQHHNVTIKQQHQPPSKVIKHRKKNDVLTVVKPAHSSPAANPSTNLNSKHEVVTIDSPGLQTGALAHAPSSTGGNMVASGTASGSSTPIMKQSSGQSRYWLPSEHTRFLEALDKFGPRDVRSVSKFVGTRSPTQVRTHAQKYFLRIAREVAMNMSGFEGVSDSNLIAELQSRKNISEGELTKLGREMAEARARGLRKNLLIGSSVSLVDYGVEENDVAMIEKDMDHLASGGVTPGPRTPVLTHVNNTPAFKDVEAASSNKVNTSSESTAQSPPVPQSPTTELSGRVESGSPARPQHLLEDNSSREDIPYGISLLSMVASQSLQNN